MKILRSHLLVLSCMVISSCNSTKEIEVVPESPNFQSQPILDKDKKSQPQDGSFIVQPKGTSKVGVISKKYYEALAAAEREVVRRQQLSIEADSVVKSAIADIDENSLDSARIKLKRAVEKYLGNKILR